MTYTRTNWVNGAGHGAWAPGATGVSAERLNNIEDGIAETGVRIGSVEAVAAVVQYLNVAALLASAATARGTGAIWKAGTYVYEEAAAAATDYHVITAGGAKLYAKAFDNTINLEQLGLSASTTDVQPLLVTAVTTIGARKVIVPYQAAAWPMLTQWSGSNCEVYFEYGARISFNMDARAMILFNVKLVNASFTSNRTGTPNSTTHPSDTRDVVLNANCIVENYYHEYATAGLTIGSGNNVRIRNARFANIRHYKGWGAAIHCYSTSTYNVHASGITITDCDRGIECEDGAHDCWFTSGKMTNVYPNGYGGQPGDYAVYTFTIGAHSHDTDPACYNIHFRDWYLVDCGGGVGFILSTGTDGTRAPHNCSAENIRIAGFTLTAGYEAVALWGYNNVVENITFEAGSGINSQMKVRFYPSGATKNQVRNFRAESYALPLIQVDDGASEASVERLFVDVAASAGSGKLVELDGQFSILEDISFYAVTGTTGYINIDQTAHGTRIDGMRYTVAAAETFTNVITVVGAASAADITGIRGTNYATVPPQDIQLGNGTNHCRVHGNTFDRGAGVCVTAHSLSNYNVVANNIATNASATFTNFSGTSVFANNIP